MICVHRAGSPMTWWDWSVLKTTKHPSHCRVDTGPVASRYVAGSRNQTGSQKFQSKAECFIFGL